MSSSSSNPVTRGSASTKDGEEERDESLQDPWKLFTVQQGKDGKHGCKNQETRNASGAAVMSSTNSHCLGSS